MPLAFAEPLLIRTIPCTERVCRLKHYSQLVTDYIPLQTICSLTVSINGLPKGSQRQCSLPGCKGTLAYYCKKCNVGLHAGYFELYPFK